MTRAALRGLGCISLNRHPSIPDSPAGGAVLLGTGRMRPLPGERQGVPLPGEGALLGKGSQYSSELLQEEPHWPVMVPSSPRQVAHRLS